MMDWSERGNIWKRGPSWSPSTRTPLFGADRRTSYGSKKKKLSGAQRNRLRKQKKQLLPNGLMEDRELEVPTAANHALGLMLIPGTAVTQKDRYHLVGHLRMPRAR